MCTLLPSLPLLLPVCLSDWLTVLGIKRILNKHSTPESHHQMYNLTLLFYHLVTEGFCFSGNWTGFGVNGLDEQFFVPNSSFLSWFYFYHHYLKYINPPSPIERPFPLSSLAHLSGFFFVWWATTGSGTVSDQQRASRLCWRFSGYFPPH